MPYIHHGQLFINYCDLPPSPNALILILRSNAGTWGQAQQGTQYCDWAAMLFPGTCPCTNKIQHVLQAFMLSYTAVR